MELSSNENYSSDSEIDSDFLTFENNLNTDIREKEMNKEKKRKNLKISKKFLSSLIENILEEKFGIYQINSEIEKIKKDNESLKLKAHILKSAVYDILEAKKKSDDTQCSNGELAPISNENLANSIRRNNTFINRENIKGFDDSNKTIEPNLSSSSTVLEEELNISTVPQENNLENDYCSEVMELQEDPKESNTASKDYCSEVMELQEDPKESNTASKDYCPEVMKLLKGHKERNTASKEKKRQKKQCPLCKFEFVNIPSHLRLYHANSEADIKDICFPLRKKRIGDLSRPQRKCPVQKCMGQTYARLDLHLRRTHGYSPNDPFYRKFIKAQLPTLKKKAGNKIIYSPLAEYCCSIYEAALKTLNGKRQIGVNPRQQAQRIRQIIHGMNLIKLEDICNDSSLKSMDKWFTEYAERNSARSAGVYLDAMDSFILYVATEKKVSSLTMDQAYRMREKFRRWKKAFTREANMYRTNDQEEVSAEEVLAFKK